MEKLIAFGIFSVPLIILSRRTLFNYQSHGFYRFFSWECILWLLVNNLQYWFDQPFGPQQIISWMFLIFSVYLVVAGSFLLKKAGKPGSNREDKNLFKFEKTAQLVEIGIYKFIRHPLYSSLLFLTWGILLKQPTMILAFVALLSTILLFLTARFDERECIEFFGDEYLEYMKRTKRFIPFIL